MSEKKDVTGMPGRSTSKRDSGSAQRMETSEGEKPAKIVYILYLAGVVFQILPLVGVVVAYVYRGDAPAWLRGHFTFQIRGFWIGLAASVVGGITTGVGIGFLILLALLIWWVARAIVGWKALSENRALANPETWWW